MKIVYCILNTWYAGGLTRVLANKANYLSKCGYDVTIITTDQFNKPHYYPMSENIKFIDLNIDYLGFDQDKLLRKGKILSKKILQHYRALKVVLEDIKADIVISLFYKDLFLLPFINDGSKKILEAHSSRFTWLDSRSHNGLFGKIQNWFDLQFIKRFDKFVVLTNEDKPDWGKLQNIIVIPNANTFESKIVASLEDKTVVASGRYGYQKNFEDLISAWTIVNQQHPDWKLLILGQGLKALEHQIHCNGLQNSIECRESKDMKSEYLKSSMIVLTSRYEGLGMVLLEAQVCGLPLVSYDCKCGPRDIITHGENGFLVKTGDIEGIAKHLLQLIDNPSLRKTMGQNAKAKSVNFSEDRIMKKWIDLFTDLKQ